MVVLIDIGNDFMCIEGVRLSDMEESAEQLLFPLSI
jgi:hypothetical protein